MLTIQPQHVTIAVGIDISKGKSTIAAISTKNNILLAPTDFTHTASSMQKIIAKLHTLAHKNGAPISNVKITMEATGHYHEIVAGIFNDASFLYLS